MLPREALLDIVAAIGPLVRKTIAETIEQQRTEAARLRRLSAPLQPVPYSRFTSPAPRPGVKVVRPATATARDPRLRLAPLPTGPRRASKAPTLPMALRVQYSKEAVAKVMENRKRGMATPYDEALRFVYDSHGATKQFGNAMPIDPNAKTRFRKLFITG